MTEIRCERCKRMLLEADTLIGVVHCPKSNCKHVNRVHLVSQKTLTTYIVPRDNPSDNQALSSQTAEIINA